MLNNTTYEEARDLLLETASPIVRTEWVPITESTGRVLAENVYAKGDVPPFDRSPYDGYAFRAEDTEGASQDCPVTLTITEEVPAGHMWTTPITRGKAVKILTGAPVPPGADAITKYEDTQFTPETVTVFQSFRAGENIVPQGEDVKTGDLLASAGTVIDGALAGTLAAQGVREPLCYAKPRVGILTTGSELVEAGEELTGGKIVNSNRYTLTAVLQKLGCEPVYLGAPGDTVEGIADLIASGMATCDMVISTGGVSVGDYDFTPAAMDRAGCRTLIRTVQLKPGGACAYGEKEGVLYCGLSGNPASAMTNFYAIVLPALRKLCGRKDVMPPVTSVTIKQDFPKRSPKTRLIRGILDISDGTCRMDITGEQGNGVLHTLIGCNLLAVIPAGTGRLPAGTRLDAFVIG